MATSKIYMNSAAAAILALGGFVCNASATPNMIGLKYKRGWPLLATDVAGAPGYEQANWTMAQGQGQGPPNTPINSLNDRNGVATSVNVTSWTLNNNNSWSDTATTLDQRLLADYCANGCSISFEGLSTYAPSGYAVVVYYECNGRSQRYILTAGSTTITRNVSMTAPITGDPSWSWLEGTESSPGTASNYTVIGSSAAPLTSDTFTIALDMTAAGWVGGTAAVQIVQLPSAATPYETWASTNAGGATAPVDGDYNHDGVQNGVAFFMGMNGLATNPGVVNGKVTWPHVGTVASWEVQVSNDLVTWDPAATGDVDTTSSPGNVIYTLPTGAPQKFCRLMVVP